MMPVLLLGIADQIAQCRVTLQNDLQRVRRHLLRLVAAQLKHARISLAVLVDEHQRVADLRDAMGGAHPGFDVRAVEAGEREGRGSDIEIISLVCPCQ